MFKKYMEKKFSKRESKEFNRWRAIFQKIVTHWTLGAYIRCRYKVEVFGKENLEKDKKYIIAANHVSGFDPFVLVFALGMPIAFMAKEQLFEHFWSRVLMDWCGAFAVNREKLEVSTIKTALAVKNSSWKLGIFPQGTRDKSSTIKNISRGFVALAKASDCNILPVSIIKTDGVKKGIIHSGKITIKIGNLIPCGDFQETMDNWGKAVSALSGLEYIPST